MTTFKQIFGYLLVILSVYAFFSFTNLSFSVFEWNTFSRFCFGVAVIYFCSETKEVIF